MWRQIVDHEEKRETHGIEGKELDARAPNREAENRIGIRHLKLDCRAPVWMRA
jgi:hypothetical protein